MYYSPSTPRLRRARSVPSMATSRSRRKLVSQTTESYVGGSSAYASHLPPPFRTRAYEHAKTHVWVPQTNLPQKSLANAGNLQPPPSYQHSMVRLGSDSRQAWALQQTRKPEIYYYLPRTYSTGGGSYYSTYSQSRRPVPSAAYRLATKLPTTSYDRPGAYISDEPRMYSSNSDRRHRVPVGHKPVTVVETYDHLEEAEPLTNVQQAEVKDFGPPVRAVQMGQPEVSTDHSCDVIDLEQHAELTDSNFEQVDVVDPGAPAVVAQ